MKNNYLLKKYLLVVICFFGFKASAQYAVSPIPHQAYAPGLAIAFTADDTYSAPISLGFDFTFFGVAYNQIQISTNGYLEFGANHPQNPGTSPWQFNTTIPDANFPVKNSFLACYHDIDNSDGEGTVTYSIEGTAPYRKLVAMYDNNSQFQCNAASKTSVQMILYETLNIMDSQIIRKDLCATWNNGNAVVGIINSDGTVAFTPSGRNTSQWETTNEGWRFSPGIATDRYNFVKCDDDTDGLAAFNLAVAQNDLWAANPSGVTFHETESDAIGQTGALATTYTNTGNSQTIYANVNGAIVSVVLRVVDCNDDFDGDSVATADEDLNSDTNLANDDTDNDGIADFVDNDDDGDLILTNEEYVFGRNANAILDTDNDGIPNYLDNDDDGDNVLTINEDYNGNNNPMDDDTNEDGTPDYLQSAVALGVNQNTAQAKTISIYPNPTSDVLNVDNKTGQNISEIALYSINGVLVKQTKNTQSLTAIPVADLQSGLYFVKIQIGNEVQNYKFIKK